MSLSLYQVDAFTQTVFGGNPAAVIPLETWLDDRLLQAIASENNLSETAYIVANSDAFDLRWFTPAVEVDLCGHATLAAAHVLFEHLDYPHEQIEFKTKSGSLRVKRSSSGLTLDFPTRTMTGTDVELVVCNALGSTASEAWVSESPSHPLLLVYEFEEDVAKLTPNFSALLQASTRPVCVTAPGDDCDFVSRFFGPQVGIDEDPVTGSAHCSLVPYWANRLNTSKLQCRQISRRGGELSCELSQGRVFMTGRAVTYLTGSIHRYS